MGALEIKRIAVAVAIFVSALTAIAVAAAVVAVGAAGSANHATRIGTRALHANQAAVSKAVQAKQLAAAIQFARAKAIVQDCEDQNDRHAHTVAQLDKILAQAEKHARTGARRFQIQQSRAPTVLLINALAPVQNCQQLAKRQAP